MMKRRTFIKAAGAAVGMAACAWPQGLFGETPGWDVVVYGATAGGVIAAVAAAREGARVALVEPGVRLGGMVSGGLGHTDHGRIETIGGSSLEFFQRVGRHYGQPVTWDFEPGVAESVFRDMVREAGVKVFFNHRLREHGGVARHGDALTALITEPGDVYPARVFIDATYEGDLLEQAGVSYTWGRESSAAYGESYAGVRKHDRYGQHRYLVPVSAFDEQGALLPNVSAEPMGPIGSADWKVQAYNFRLCLTRNRDNQVPIPRPDDYDPRNYELLARLIAGQTKQAGQPPRMNHLMIVSPLPNGKTDINNQGAFSTDVIGKSWDYPTAGYRRRAQIWQEHSNYTTGFFWFLQHDERVPAPLRSEVASWGLAADEFTESGHWPAQLYVREARRMISDTVFRQQDGETELTKPDVIAVGSYNMDTHNAQRYVQADGTVQNEGDTQIPTIPFHIPYRILTPKRQECTNLLVPVCPSSTHVGYGGLRLEPDFMKMGQAVGVAAQMAVQHASAVQDVNIPALQAKLRSQKVVLEWSNPKHLHLHPVQP